MQTNLLRLEYTPSLILSSSGILIDVPTSLTYRIYDERKNHGVNVSFFSQTPSSSAKIRLISDTALDGIFYRTHEHFSVRTILSILHDEIPYKQVAQLVEEACIP